MSKKNRHIKLYLLFVILLITLNSLGQDKSSVLAVNVDFEHVKGFSKHINGVAYNGKYHQIRHGKLITPVDSGTTDLQITLSITGHNQQWKKSFKAVEFKAGDTTLIEIPLSDNFLPSVSKIAFSEKEGPFYPQNKVDTLSSTDAQGLKQGLWWDFSNKIGNCIDELDSKYQCYFDDTLRYEILFHFDYNICLKSNHILSVIRYDKSGTVIDIAYHYSIEKDEEIAAQPGVSSAFDHNQCSHNDIKKLLSEFIAEDFMNVTPSFFDKFKLSGSLRVQKGDKTGEAIPF